MRPRKPQGHNELLIDTTPEQLFAILSSSDRVLEYMHAVKHVDVAGGRREQVGSIRTCQVEMDGKQGEVVERCIELVPDQRISFVVDRDTFGFSKLFSDFGFTFTLDPRDDRRTLVALEGFYRERHPLAHVRGGILAGLKATAEQPAPGAAVREARLASTA